MKKLFLTLGACALSINAFAQGELPIENMITGVSSTFDDESLEKNAYKSIANWYVGDLDAVISEGGYDGSDYCLEIKDVTAGQDYYTAQIGYSFSEPLTPGTYYLQLYAKTTAEGASIQATDQNSGFNGYQYPTASVTSDWQLCVFKFTITQTDVTRIAINMGKYSGDYYFDDIQFGPEIPASEVTINNVINGLSSTFDDGSLEKNAYKSIANWYVGDLDAIVSEGGYDGSDYCLEIKDVTAGQDYYTAQIGYSFNNNLEPGVYVFRFYAKTTAENASIQVCYQDPSFEGYDYTVIQVGNEWQSCAVYFTITKENINRVAINMGKYSGDYYYDNIEFGPVAEGEQDVTNPKPPVIPENPVIEIPSGLSVILEGSQLESGKIFSWSEQVTNGQDYIEVNNPEVGEDDKNYSIQLNLDANYQVDEYYYVQFEVKGTPSATGISAYYQGPQGENITYDSFNNIYVRDDETWETVVLKGLCTTAQLEASNAESVGRIAINLGLYEGTMYIKNIKVYGPEPDEDLGPQIPSNPKVTIPDNLEVLASGDVADGTTFVKWDNAFENAEVGDVECVKFTNETAGDNYSQQFAIDLNYQVGQEYYVQFDLKGTPSTTGISAYYQGPNGKPNIAYNSFNTIYVTSENEWETVVLYGKYTESDLEDKDVDAAGRIAINLGAYVGTLYMTHFKVYGPEEDTTVPTPGEFAATVTPNSTEGWFDSFSVVWAEKLTEPYTLKIVDESLISVVNAEGEELEFTANLTEYQETEESENYEDSQLVITLDQIQMEAGKYSLTIQAGAVQINVDDEWVDNELVEYSFTLKETPEPGSIDDPMVSPTDGSKLTSLESVTLTWEDWGVVAVDNYEGDPISMTITTDTGKQSMDLDFEIIGENPNGGEEGGNAVKVVLKQIYSEEGVYTIVIPEGMFFISNLDGVNGYNETMTLTYTVASAPSVVESLYDLNGNSEVYNLNGVKVGNTENLKSLKKGIYIVNGKKVVIR